MKTPTYQCKSIYNGETQQVENCTCGKCADALKTPPSPIHCLKCDVVDHDIGLCECPCHPTHEEIMTKPMKANTPTRKLIAKIVKKVLKEYKLTFKLLGKE
jgi:hypothetical protein